jgi:glycogen operon protein
VGSFIGERWKEWNGRFRDDARSFFRGEDGAAPRFADRFVGSPEIYAHKEREPEQSVNFVTCHDGFTLNDLVSYDRKHNEANGENDRDGSDDNRSWNCGFEGASVDPAIEQLRNRQIKNFLAATLLSIGMPMILMGDEVRRTQGGNNNHYCHDDESAWFDWTLLDRHADVHRFVSLLNERRLLRDLSRESQRLTLTQLISQTRKEWHGVRLNQPDWSRQSHTIAFCAVLPRDHLAVHCILNAYWEALDFELPTDVGTGPWRRWIDTALASPDDISSWQEAPAANGLTYQAAPRSVVVLVTGTPAG